MALIDQETLVFLINSSNMGLANARESVRLNGHLDEDVLKSKGAIQKGRNSTDR